MRNMGAGKVTGQAEEDSAGSKRDFFLLLTGQTVSAVGNQISFLAMPLLVIALTGSATSAGIVASIGAAARFLLRLPAGSIADRVERRRLMLWCEITRALAMAALTVVASSGAASIYVIAVLAVVEGVAAVLFAPAERAALRNLVDRRQLRSTASRYEARGFVGEIAGLALGGLLFGIARWVPFLANAVTYLFSYTTVRMIKSPLQDRRTGRRDNHGSLGRDTADGLRFVLGEPFLRTSVLLVTVLNLAYFGTMFVMVTSLIKGGISSLVVGIASATVAASGLLGAVAAPALHRRLSPRALLLSIFWTMSGGIAVAAAVPGLLWVVAPLSILMFLVPAVNGTLFAYQVAVTPDDLQARVHSVLAFAAGSLSPLAPLIAGWLVDQSGRGAAMALFSVLLCLASLVATFSSGIRAVELNEAALR
jgi:MFS family permease